MPAGRQLPPFLIRRLVWWAEHELRKLKQLPEGGTLGDSFASFRRQTGKPHPEDREHITPPVELLYLWEWFWQLNQGRPVGPEGVQLPLPNGELHAWSNLSGIRLEKFELAALRALDAAYMKSSAEKTI